MSKSLLYIALSTALSAPVFAQQAPDKIPLRKIGPILAAGTENVGAGIIARGLPNGRVIVSAGARQKVYSFDSTLTTFDITIDSASGTGSFPITTTGIIPFTPDSTLVADMGSNSLLVIGPDGKVARAMAAPRPQDLIYLAIPAAYGRPGFDPKGRLVYRSIVQQQPKVTPTTDGNQKVEMAKLTSDSSPVIRGDLDARTVDTVAWTNTPNPGRMTMDQKPNNGGMLMKLTINPFPLQDEWALLTDGTIAVVRAHDYHVDWVYPDGTKRATSKMPFDWKRYTDEQKQHQADSVKGVVENQIQTALKSRATGLPPGMSMSVVVDVVPATEFPDYYAPVSAGSVQADLENHLWILPTTSVQANNGFTYDVVNRDGEIIERVQLPKDRVVAGFGPKGVVYLAHTAGDKTLLERSTLPRPAATAGQ